MEKEYICPCEEVDPDNFITNEEVRVLLETQDKFKFKQEDYYRLYNCVHCGACGTQNERFLLKQKFLKDGNQIENLNKTIETIKTYGTPFKYNKSRIKPLKGLNKNSRTLLYFGCFTTVKVPSYGENIAKYLLNNHVDFCILEQEICCGYPILCTGEVKTYDLMVEKNKKFFLEKGFKKIITVCPSCYMVFKKHYSDLGIKTEYFTEYLSPSQIKKSGDLIIQHACPLKHIEFPKIEEELKIIYEKSDYNVLNIPHYCCGGGVGHQLRVDVAEKIALKRMRDFKQYGGHISNKEENERFITTYCPDAYWILKFYGKKEKIRFQLKDPCDLLM